MSQGLYALSPLDGRYASQLADVTAIGGEAGLIGYRLRVELHWLLALAQEPAIAEISAPNEQQAEWLLALEQVCDPAEVKAIEAKTNHDVKALEYWLKSRLAGHSFWGEYAEFVHFACTSEDINSLAYALMARDLRAALLTRLDAIASRLAAMAGEHAALPLLALTHGQPASPTTLGKEMVNTHVRLERQMGALRRQELLGKLNGAVGNYNAHVLACPEVDWPALTQRVVEGLQLTCNPLTTQIEPHDWMAEYCHTLARVNTILLDLARDIWGYISRGLFVLALKPGEVGSSTMPHKVNPIDFENAEGNLGVANALLEHLAAKLPVSRWQRDLSDSTVLRNFGSAAGYCAVAYQALERGLGKLSPNPEQLAAELTANPEVLAEAIQTMMRRHGVDKPYERLKELTRGKQLRLEDIGAFIDQQLEQAVPDEARERLKALTPADYTGLAEQMVRQYLDSLDHQGARR